MPDPLTDELAEYIARAKSARSPKQQLVEAGASFLPGIGEVLSLETLMQGVQQNDPLKAGLGAIGLVPMVGAATRFTRGSAAVGKSLSTARAISGAASATKATRAVKAMKPTKSLGEIAQKSEGGMIVGPRVAAASPTARSMMLKALEMERKGATPLQTWKKTLWWRGEDGVMRFELDDSNAVFHVSNKIGPPPRIIGGVGWEAPGPDVEDMIVNWRGPLIEVLRSHPALYNTYPELIHLPVGIGYHDFPAGITDTVRAVPTNRKAPFIATGIRAFGPTEGVVEATVMHELSHVIQMKEGMDWGGNTSYRSQLIGGIGRRIERLSALLREAKDDESIYSLGERIRSLNKTLGEVTELTPRLLYRSILGEQEARLTQRSYSAGLNAIERTRRFPPESRDSPVTTVVGMYR